ncbi:fimbrial assembly protein FimA [Bacillus sp. MKU004]|nr:fimbrial assembly protein FimA [Bacillus sp. MKU004]
MTYSIVGYDPEEKEWGIAVQSKFLGVGSVVPFAKAGVGAVATQSYANTAYGPHALQLMEEGKTAEEALDIITKDDPERHLRQVGLIDAWGHSATFTGEGCYDWAGGMTGKYFTAQGNILVDENTVKAMAETFESTEGSLAERLLHALDAGQDAGGDSRGMQSAALLVVKEKGGYGGFNDRYIDLRVDDHASPIKELKRIYLMHQLYFKESDPGRVVLLEGEVRDALEKELKRHGYADGSKSLHQALKDYLHTENFEMREQEENYIDLDVLDYMKKQGR